MAWQCAWKAPKASSVQPLRRVSVLLQSWPQAKRPGAAVGRPSAGGREEQAADGRLGLFHHEPQADVDCVVDGDLAPLACEQHATQARGAVLALHWRRGKVL